MIEWHPTAQNLLLSSAYDYKVRPPPPPAPPQNQGSKAAPSPQVLLWDVSQVGAVLRSPLRVVLRPVFQRHPPEALLLSACFSADGGRLAVTSRDRRVRVLDPQNGKILQASRSRSHQANKVLYLTHLKMLLSTGRSPWDQRQVVLWDPVRAAGPGPAGPEANANANPALVSAGGPV